MGPGDHVGFVAQAAENFLQAPAWQLAWILRLLPLRGIGRESDDLGMNLIERGVGV